MFSCIHIYGIFDKFSETRKHIHKITRIFRLKKISEGDTRIKIFYCNNEIIKTEVVEVMLNLLLLLTSSPIPFICSYLLT